MTEYLKSCPFCGQLPKTFPKNPELEGAAWFKVSCTYRGCKVKPSAEAYDDFDAKRMATDAWNKRPRINN